MGFVHDNSLQIFSLKFEMDSYVFLFLLIICFQNCGIELLNSKRAFFIISIISIRCHWLTYIGYDTIFDGMT